MDRASRNGARRGNGHSHDQRVGKPRQFIASRRRSPVGRGAARDRVHRNRGDRRPNVGRGGRTRLAAPPGAQDRYTGFRTRGAEGRAANARRYPRDPARDESDPALQGRTALRRAVRRSRRVRLSLSRPDARVRRPQTHPAPPGGRVVRARLKEGVDGAPDKGEPSAYSPTLRRNTGPLKSRSSAWRGRVTIRCARRNCVTTRSSPFCSLPINFRKRIRLLAFIFSSSLPLLVMLVSCRRYVLKNSGMTSIFAFARNKSTINSASQVERFCVLKPSTLWNALALKKVDGWIS